MFLTYLVDASVVPLGVDAARFHPLDISREGFVLSVGAIHPNKGYEFLIESIAKIPEDTRPRLVIAASSADAAHATQLEQGAAGLGVDCQIQRIWDDGEMTLLYNRATAFVYAPVMEAFGLAALEAQACGTPVVAVQEGGIRESVLDGVTGLLTERDTTEFADALQCILQDSRLGQRLGDAGVEHVRSRWRWARAIDRAEERFERLLGGQAA